MDLSFHKQIVHQSVNVNDILNLYHRLFLFQSVFQNDIERSISWTEVGCRQISKTFRVQSCRWYAIVHESQT